jgi:DNA polymerase beta
MVKKEVIINEFKTLIKKLKTDLSLLKDKTEANAINFKIRNFIKVVKSLEEYTSEDIIKSEQLKDLDGIGKGTLTRIDEIIEKGILSEAHQEVTSEDAIKAKNIEDLMTITGIGPAKASELNTKNITLASLLLDYKNKDTTESDALKLLTHHQIIGLKYYKQFQKRIPREKITKIDTKIQKLLTKFKKINKISMELIAIICGSYRRGAIDSGDIDLLISGDSESGFDLIEFIKFLSEEELIIDSLTEKGTTKFMGVCQGGYRIDIRFISKESFGAALMYFTGSKTFNTLVRTEALRQGYTLEEYGLYPLIKDEKILEDDKIKLKEKKKVSHSHQHMKGEKIPCPTEETIFDILKIDKKYLDPTNRDIPENIGSL